MRHLLLVSLLSLAACAGGGDRPETELLIENVRLLDRADADTVLVRGERIVAVGPRERVLGQLRGRPERIVDGRGGLLLPGFDDAHCHPLGGALAGVETLDLAGSKSLAEVQERLRSWADAHPGEWIQGKNWSYDVGPEAELTAAALDQAVADRPVALSSYDGHTTWVNSAALRRAGLSGSGLLKEGEGGEKLEAAIPKLPPAEQKEILLGALREMVALGITAVGAMGVDAKDLTLYAELEDEGRLPLRVFAWMPWETDLDQVVALRKQHHGGRVQVVGIKGFLDGVLETGTAYLLEGYAGEDGAKLGRGKPLIEPGALERRVAECSARGIPVALHSIGDGSTRLALEVFARAGRGLRHRLEHLELVHPEDYRRFAELGVVASMQPYHAIPSDGDPDTGAWSEHVGKARLPLTFPWRKLRDAGATLAFGSDWDVFTNDPLQGLAVAITRRNQKGHPPAGWYAEQCLTFREAVEAYTVGSAWAVGQEGELGKIEPDYLADLVLLDPQVKVDDPTTLWTGKVRAVVVGGRVVD